jgi:Family of unknown function (DUF5519)
MRSPHDRIVAAVLEWPGVTATPHRFGGTEFRMGRIELGHLHGNRLADLPFPKRVRNELVEQRRAEPHHVLKDSGWISRRIRGNDDVDAVIELFRLNYERVSSRRNNVPRRSVSG